MWAQVAAGRSGGNHRDVGYSNRQGLGRIRRDAIAGSRINRIDPGGSRCTREDVACARHAGGQILIGITEGRGGIAYSRKGVAKGRSHHTCCRRRTGDARRIGVIRNFERPTPR